MPDHRYAPGTWWGVVARDVVALIPETVPEETAIALYEDLTAGSGFSAVLTRLAASVGGNLLDLPPFAVHIRDGGAGRVLVRGPITVHLGDDVLGGGGTMTWQERTVEPGVTVTLTADEQAPAVPALPVGAGVVRCAALTVGAGSAHMTPAPVAPSSAARHAAAARQTAGHHTSPTPIAPATSPIPGESSDVAAIQASQPVSDHALPAISQPTIAEFDEDPDPAFTAGTGPVRIVTHAPLVEHVPSADGGSSYEDLLFGATVSRNVQDAAVWSQSDEDGASPPDSDHDQHTLSIAEARKLAASASASAPGERADRGASRGLVRLSTGQECAVDRPVLIGRRPQATRVRADEVPHLLTVPSPNQDISRSHVEIRPEGSHVTAADLGTTNGTVLRRPGRQAVRLVAAERQVLLDGDVLDIGDGVTVTFSEETR